MRSRILHRLLAAVVFMAACAHLFAQAAPAQFDLDSGRVFEVALDGQWHFHPGDSPMVSGAQLWASPGFDDSTWPLLRSDKPWSTQGYPDMSGYAWYRFQVQIPAGQKPVSLLLAPIVTAYELYIDGRLAGSTGAMSARSIPNTDFAFHLFPLMKGAHPQPRTVTIAIRVWHSPIWASYVGGGPFQSGNLAGDAGLLLSEHHHRRITREVIFVDQYAYSIAAGIVGIVILWLFYVRPAEREYFWFALMPLAQAADCMLNISRQVWAFPPIPLFDLSDGILTAIIIIAAFCFLSRVLKASIGTWERLLLGLAAVSPFAAILYWPGWFSTAVSAAIQLGLSLPAIVWILVLLIRRAVAGNTDARVLAAPLLLSQGFFVVFNLLILLAQGGLMPWPDLLFDPLPLPPFTIHLQVLFNLVFLVAMLVFLILRFVRARRREVRLADEFEAARQVQQVLLPNATDQCPGFAVDFAYYPAEEVGGDFFQQIADGQGGLLIVVGDVSGKGLPAAMLVAALAGAIRAEAAHGKDPAALLHCLNERVLARSQAGFVTALAAHIAADGRMTIANAGHLSPYVNGVELDVPGSLPLGVVPQIDYDTAGFALAPGDRIAFVSDGVIEAHNRAGEMFGFERTREISRESAHAISHIAQAFGQDDDITVVTVDFTGAG